MPLLTKCVYGLQTDPKKTPFGLLNNQVKIDNTIQSAGWFNIKGERLGCGDLTIKDMDRIAKHISAEEIFVAVGEANCEWNMPAGIDRTAPGFDYVISKAVWVMAKSNIGGIVLRVRDDIEKQEEAEKDGIKYLRIPRADLYKAMTQPAPVKKAEAEKPKLDDDLKAKKAAALAKAKAILSQQQTQMAAQMKQPSQSPSSQTSPAQSIPTYKKKSSIGSSSSSSTTKPLKKTSKGYLTP